MNDGVRWGRPGELCTCGRQAIEVFETDHGPVGWCRISDGGNSVGPCPFCGSPRKHFTPWGDLGRCPSYRLRLVGGDV
ncbi:hypothetical protein GCM10022220_05350 [Actinocatenispora rupis]|uniref:Uncharacterized protein n=1 Tax=Actinocatenispora rupis TaxID=519421 RepID=A0A8J3J561_9ACTN|nr:hypothetical protein Aru02nite_68900 [Actinocatenispora rupis]